MDENFPDQIPLYERNKGNVYIADWNQKDVDLVKEVEVEYKMLLQQDKPVRITKSILGKRTGMTTILNMNINKLPRTKAYIEHIIEAIEDFQIRRINEICRQLYGSKSCFKKWEVIRKAGLRPGYSNKVDEAINENIKRYIVRG